MKNKLTKRYKAFVTSVLQSSIGFPLGMMMWDRYSAPVSADDRTFRQYRRHAYTKQGRIEGVYHALHGEEPKQYCHGQKGKLVSNLLTETKMDSIIDVVHTWWLTNPEVDGKIGDIDILMCSEQGSKVVDGKYNNSNCVQIIVKHSYQMILHMTIHKKHLYINGKFKINEHEMFRNIHFPNEYTGTEEDVFQMSLLTDLDLLSDSTMMKILQIGSTLLPATIDF